MRITITLRLALAFTLLILLLAISGYVSINSFNKLDQNIKNITEIQVPSSEAAMEMEINLIGSGFGLLGYLGDHDQKHLERIQKDHLDFKKFSRVFSDLADTQEAHLLDDEIEAIYQEFILLMNDLINLEDQQTVMILNFESTLDIIDDILDEKIQLSIDMDKPYAQQQVQATMELEININGIAKGLGSYLWTPSLQYIERINKDTADFSYFLAIYEELPLSKEEKQWAIEIRKQFEIILSLSNLMIENDMHKVKKLARVILLRRKMDVIMDDQIQVLTEKKLVASQKAVFSLIQSTNNTILLLFLAGVLIAILLSVYVTRTIKNSLYKLTEGTVKIGSRDYEHRIQVDSNDEFSDLGVAFNQMAINLQDAARISSEQTWMKTGLNQFKDVMSGEPDIKTLATKVISEISSFLNAQVGAIYFAGNGDTTDLSLQGSYAYKKRKNLSNQFKMGEGLVGQAALEKQQILISNVPEDYIKITSGFVEGTPKFLCVTPFINEEGVKGVVEVGTYNEMTDQQLEYIEQVMPVLALVVQSVHNRVNLSQLLENSQKLSVQLQAQQGKLKAANEELEKQTQMLQVSEEKLKVQQGELQVTNEELEEKTEFLQHQKQDVEKANEELEITRQNVEEKAEELALASKYKSEFLANMSHELRTPLNSLLILASTLAENKEGNLNEHQVESAKVIDSSGNDLLALINEILDLSKIEAGQMSLELNDVKIRDLADSTKASFLHMGKEKGLELKVNIARNTPKSIRSDKRRIEQVIKNLMSNALKFTDKGEITVSFSQAGKKADLSRSGLDSDKAVAISVKDTGVGISADNQKIIFEAFQQVEGGTTRKYGGTGLGLSISRELVRLLGGEIQLESEEGKGSVFMVYLPVEMADVNDITAEPRTVMPSNRKALQNQVTVVPDDRADIKDDDTVVLIIEDDAKFTQVLMNECHGKGFKCLASATGEEGLELVGKYQPKAILLDIMLPGIDGWTILSILKDQTDTRHIPVHIISAVEDASVDALKKGAIGYLQKPVTQDDLKQAFDRIQDIFSRKVKKLLVVEDDQIMRKNIVKLIGNGDVHTDETTTGKETIEKLKSGKYDCMILDLGLPDMTGIELLEIVAKFEDIAIPPVIIYTAREITREDDKKLRQMAESVIIKGVQSEERLLDEASLFLHRVVGKLTSKKRKIIVDLHDADSIFKNKKVLIVDDDMRNIFALSKSLEDKGMETLKAEDGQKALSLLKENSDIDLVLMDIMMPVMDGYKAMKRIRAQKKFQQLPIIALTAKAMKEDRIKCIDAGANDYLTKPVNLDRLFSAMRVWLYR